jgi:hypothetical protein
MTPAKQMPVEFTPMQGLLAVGRKVAEHFGLTEIWAGHDGLEGVMKQKLSEMGIPEQAIPISGPKGMTPRQMAEQSGFIKRPRPQRRVKAK